MDFFQKVYQVTQQIPEGRITTYGTIANYLGAPRSARMVGWALNKSNVNIITGSWYDVKDSLSTYDGIFYDTFGDENMKNFSSSLSSLTKSNTKVTWWNNNTNETNYYNIPNVTYQAINVDPPTNSYFNNTIYYLPKKQF